MSPETERQVLDRLTAIEARLDAGAQRFEAFDRHVTDCSEDKRALRTSLLVLSGSLIVAAVLIAVS